MPNWCQNRVHIQGTPERIQELREFVSAENELKTTAWFDLSQLEKDLNFQNDYEKFVDARHNAQPHPFSLNSIVPQPANIFRGNLGQKEREQCELEGRPNWYDWNNNNWGTKWDVNAEFTEISDDEIEYSFDSAWAPPVPVIRALAARFPDLSITHTFIECGGGFCGRHCYEDGFLTDRRDDQLQFSEDEDDWEILGPSYAAEGFGTYA